MKRKSKLLAPVSLSKIKTKGLYPDGENLYLCNTSLGWFKLTKSDFTWREIKSPEDIYLPTGVLTYGNYSIYPLLGDGILVSNGSELIFKNSGLSNNSILGICLVGDVVYVVNPFYIQFANINDLTRMNATEESNSLTRSVCYPNPASGVLNIRTEAEAGTRAKAVVTDLLGNAVQSVEFESCPAELQIRLEGLAAGTYCVTVYSNGQKSKSEMIIKY